MGSCRCAGARERKIVLDSARFARAQRYLHAYTLGWTTLATTRVFVPCVDTSHVRIPGCRPSVRADGRALPLAAAVLVVVLLVMKLET